VQHGNRIEQGDNKFVEPPWEVVTNIFSEMRSPSTMSVCEKPGDSMVRRRLVGESQNSSIFAWYWDFRLVVSTSVACR
jgi:hypothetical protein